MINGLLIVNKPKDYTSRDVVNIVSKTLQTKKIGHTGTLDPLATGVLVLTIGKATKLSEIITSNQKEYIAEAIFGIETDTLDITGTVLNNYDCYIDENTLIECVNSFKKTYLQEVPIYSAVKVNGKKLYEYARNNQKVELPKKEVTVFDIEVLNIKYENNKTILKFKTLVSKGTYIRSLINDIAISLHHNAVMSNLTRTKQGKYELSSAYNLDDIANNSFTVISLENALENYYIVEMDETLENKIKNGQFINNIYNQQFVLFKSSNILALYKNDQNLLKPFKMFL